jgi:2-amino-4-hydroxy-6-hydroxymethyldihydropteridine diphosphokinase
MIHWALGTIFPQISRLFNAFSPRSFLRMPYTSNNMHSNDMIYIALGSNMDEKALNIQTALKELTQIGEVISTSRLYQSTPMYYTDQPTFLNAACAMKSSLPPLELLNELKRIESKLGRKESFRNGPRIIDLDLLFYGQSLINHDRLEIPHPRLAERSFVLKPLVDLNPLFHHPKMGKTIEQLWSEYQQQNNDDLYPIIPLKPLFNNQNRHLILNPKYPLIMGIVNVTPDR